MDEDSAQTLPAGSPADPIAEIEALLREFESEAGEVRDAAALEELRARYVGRKRGRLLAITNRR